MSYSLHSHVRSDKVKWVLVFLALLVVGAILCGLITNWYKEFNPFCWFGHDYGEGVVCVRCGKDKPIENESNYEQPEVLISEPHQMFASASPLMASNDGISTQTNAEIISLSSVPTGYRLLKVGDNLSDVDSYVIDIHSKQGGEYDFMDVFSTNSGKVQFFAYDTSGGLNFGFVDGSKNLAQYDPDTVSSVLSQDVWSSIEAEQISASRPYIQFDVREFLYMHVDISGTVTAIGSRFANSVYVKLVSKQLPPAPTKTGYTFTGWYTDEACTNKYTAPTVISDITLYAGFRANTYNIKFNANSGLGTMENEPMTYDQAKNLTANGFNKEHYAFKGWATSANGAVVYSNEQSVINLTSTQGATIELFAIWERSEVKVDFVANGNTTSIWVAIGTKATLPANPTKDGHNFVGWYFENGSKYETQNLSEDTTLTAKFEIIRCTVIFIVDGEVYSTYICDWGTSLADALNANDVNPALLKTEDEYSRNF